MQRLVKTKIKERMMTIASRWAVLPLQNKVKVKGHHRVINLYPQKASRIISAISLNILSSSCSWEFLKVSAGIVIKSQNAQKKLSLTFLLIQRRRRLKCLRQGRVVIFRKNLEKSETFKKPCKLDKSHGIFLFVEETAL